MEKEKIGCSFERTSQAERACLPHGDAGQPDGVPSHPLRGSSPTGRALRSPTRPPVSGEVSQNVPERAAAIPRRVSFREAIGRAEEQVGFCRMEYRDKLRPLVHDMCRVMAEVYMARPSVVMVVAGESMEAGMIAEVFAELTEEHVMHLASRLYEGWELVAHPRAYLRSALYNAVFEFASVVLRDVLGG